MLTGIEKMAMKMRAVKTCRTDLDGPACRRGDARGAWRVARFAVVAVMAIVFGLAGFVGSAEAVNVTYNTMKSNGVTLGALTTDWSEGAGVDVAAPKITAMAVGGAFGTDPGDRIEATGYTTQILLTTISDTAYSVDKPVTGVSYRVGLRERSTTADEVQIDLGYVDDSGFNSWGSVVQAGLSNVINIWTIDLSSISGTAPAGSYLAVRATGINGSGGNELRLYPWETGSEAQLIVDECESTGTLSVTSGQTLSGSPVDLTTISTVSNASNVVYTVTDGAAGAPATIQSEDWETKSSEGTNFNPDWVDDGSCWYTFNGGTTPSGTTTGSGSMYVYLEGSGTGTGTPPGCGLANGNTYTFEQKTTMDASTYAISFDFWYNNEGADAGDVLVLDVWNGTSWDTGVATIQTGPSTAGGTTGSVDLDALGYTSGNIKVRFSYTWSNNGNTFAKDLVLDDFVFTGTPRPTFYYDSSTDGPATSVDTSSWPAGTLYLTINGDDATCGGPLTQAQDTFTFVDDSTPPTAGTVTVSPESADQTKVPAAFTVTTQFTDAESAVTSCEYTLDGSAWSAGVVSGGGPYTCTANVTGQSDGANLIINMRATSGGGGPTTATSINRTVDAVAPTTSISVAGSTSGSPVAFTVTFSEAVTGFTNTDVTLGGTAGATTPVVSGGPSAYTVDVTGMTGDGTITMNIAADSAFDAVSNGNTVSNTPSTNWTSCIEQATVSLDAVPATITGPLAITATLGGSGGSVPLVRWKQGAGVWSAWQASGATYTPPLGGSVGTVQFEAKATGSCGGEIFDTNNPTVTNYDSRNDLLEPVGVPIAVQVGLTGINVTFSYCNDKNNTGRFQVDYKLSSSGTWTIGTQVADGGAGDADGVRNESVLIELTGLITGETYDVRMTFIDDTDGVNGTPVHTTSVALLAWADDPLLHNALRFACDKPGYADQTSCEAAGGVWTLNRKWATGWGTDVGEYGPITCSTCHAKNTGNIKRVQPSVTAASGSFPGSAVTFLTAEDGTSDFGNDAGGHATSDRVCEVCHSQTQFHNYDTANNSGGTGHYNQADCIKCHEHKLGFRASCEACHDSPPIDAGGLVTSDPTGSTTWGEHQKHAIDLAYDCVTCHNGWETTGEMPKGGDINIGYDVPFGAAGIDGGTYEGRPAASGSYTADAATVTVVTQDTAATDMSCAVYCHGYATPVWNPASTADCGACHGEVGSYADDRAGAPTGGTSLDLSGAGTGFKVGKHANHLDNSLAETGDPCALCHDGFGYADATHVDGTVNVKLNAAAGVTATFTAGGPGTCSNMDCHGDASWDSAAAGGCTLCHDYPPNSGGVHASGVNPVNHDMFSANGVPSNHDDCTFCHGYKDNGSGTLLPLTVAQITAMKGDPAVQPLLAGYHMDGSVTMNGNANATVGDDAGYNSGNAGCDSAACHGNDVNHRFNGGSSTGNAIQLADIGPGACSTCHDTGVSGAPVVSSASTHTKADGVTFGDCTDCHSGHYASGSGIQIPNNTTVGIEYTAAGHGGIMLGGTEPTIVASIRGKGSEAEICWGCHDALGTISEWGVNNKAATGNMTYDYGSLSTSNWTTASWNSGKGRLATEPFWYKRGAIQSTHTANPAVTDAALGGTPYAHTETPNAVAEIRCSYCHDVHELAQAPGDTKAGSPYLRGTWRGNPYPEDGAPQSGMNDWTLSVGDGSGAEHYGRVPRGSTSSTNTGDAAWSQAGGFWIDQNSGDPNSAITTVDQHGGLCILCHTGGVDNLDQVTGENLWVSGGNGHMNSVIGGSGTNLIAHNIFSTRKRGSGTVYSGDRQQPNAYPNMGGYSESTDRLMSYRGTAEASYGYSPLTGDNSGGLTGYRGRAFYWFEWGSSVGGSTAQIAAGTQELVVDDNDAATDIAAIAAQTQSQYHTFNCGKCHNPHASRLPKLMITNCLDTKQNSWDDDYQTAAVGAAPWDGTRISQWPSAQNCHRLADDHTTTSRGAGWNKVTPW